MKRQRESEEEKSGKIAKTTNEPPKPMDRLRNVEPLPKGWLDCPGAGEPIANLIPFKLLLGETFNELLDPRRRYLRRHVVRHQQALKHKIGLVIDLTNTSCYYNSNEWTNDGVKYVKGLPHLTALDLSSAGKLLLQALLQAVVPNFDYFESVTDSLICLYENEDSPC